MPTSKSFRIKCYGLGLDTGATLDLRTRKPVPGPKPFTRIFPYETMRHTMETSKPWIEPFSGIPRFLNWDDCLDDWWHAFEIGNQLSMYLTEDGPGDGNVTPPILTSGWWSVM